MDISEFDPEEFATQLDMKRDAPEQENSMNSNRMTCVNCGDTIPTPTADPFYCPKCRAPKKVGPKAAA